MADEVSVVFSAQIGQLIDGVSKVKEAILSIAEPVARLQESFGQIGEGLAAAFAVEKIDEFFVHFGELATMTQRNAALLGVTTEEISGLDIAAKASGGSLEGLVSSMSRLGLALARAGAGSEEARAGLRALGIQAQEFQALSPQAKLEELADRFSRLKDGIDKDAIAMAVMGRAGAQMIPILNEGAAGLKEFEEIAERSGSQMSRETVAAFEQTDRRVLELKKSLEGLGITIASIFKPAFDAVVKILTDMVQGFNDSLRQGGAMKTVMDALSVAARGFAAGLAVAVAALETLKELGVVVVRQLANDFTALGKIIVGAFTLDSAAIKSAWSEMLERNHAAAVTAAGNMEGVVKNLMSQLNIAFGDGAAHQVRLAIVNRDAVAARIKEIDGEIKALQLGLEKKKAVFEGEARAFQITQNQKFGMLQAATEQEYQAELALLEKEKQIGGLKEAQAADINNKILALKAKHETDMIKLDQASIAEQTKLWQQYTGAIESAFNSQLRGLLAGTTSWSQAVKNIMGDLLIRFIEIVEKMAIEWVTAELAKPTATTTGAAARAAAETTAASTSILAQIGNVFGVIAADAAKTFAGVFAFLSPEMGPAAAGPAAASEATVMAAGAMVPALDVGTDLVLKPGLAFLHSGEAVVPAAQTSGPFTGNGVGAGGGASPMNLNVSIQAMDTQTGYAFLKKAMPQLARDFSNYMSRNPGSRPSFA